MEKTFLKQTAMGTLRGVEKENVLEYRAIRYATAKRWEYPTAVDSWEGEYDATCHKDCCYQMRAFEEDAVCNPFYSKEFRAGMSFTYSEDCLFLSITTPKAAEKCPVLIYIHGGSFTGGSSDEGHISGDRFAENGVVFVAVNYRLGPYGFCSHPDLANGDGVCGNYGLFDQQRAIRWVYDHIGEFGGDREKITLIGQSAGAMSVDIQVSSPLNKGLIKAAILSSGAGLQRHLLRPVTPKKSEKFWSDVMINARVSSMQELRDTDPKTLYYAWLKATKASPINLLYTLPVYDGSLLRKESFSPKSVPDMPYLMGITVTDMMPIILYRNTKKWAKLCKGHTEPIYTYMFSRLLPGDDKGAWHACDLMYFFSTLSKNWRPFEAIDYKISEAMSDAVIAFTKNGSPNCDGIPEWLAGGRTPMTFGDAIGMAKWDVMTILKNTFKKG